ncbi:MAG TPA: V-type ATP synthase subunit D [Myxococcales bacterium]|nr:V-type ATP synthase subunit D [Myxococcales bacterium]
MSGPAVRSRLPELRRARDAAERGRDVLEQKLELLRREWARRRELRERASMVAESRLLEAVKAAREARIEVGRGAMTAAALAQPKAPEIEWSWTRITGVRVPALRASARPFRALYGTGGTAASLDTAAEAAGAALTALVALAAEDAAAKALRRATLKTLRRVNALDHAVLPQIRRDLREIAAALEEDERDESIRRNAWLAMR